MRFTRLQNANTRLASLKARSSRLASIHRQADESHDIAMQLEKKFPAVILHEQIPYSADPDTQEFNIYITDIDLFDLVKHPAFAEYESLSKFFVGWSSESDCIIQHKKNKTTFNDNVWTMGIKYYHWTRYAEQKLAKIHQELDEFQYDLIKSFCEDIGKYLMGMMPVLIKLHHETFNY